LMMGVAGDVVGVEAAGAAVARRRARYRAELGEPGGVEGARSGDLRGLLPGPVHLADHERLDIEGSVEVGPAGAAVARRPARHRGGVGDPGWVEGAQPGALLCCPPGALALGDHDRLLVAGLIEVGPAGAAVARRPARH